MLPKRLYSLKEKIPNEHSLKEKFYRENPEEYAKLTQGQKEEHQKGLEAEIKASKKSKGRKK